MSLLVAEGIHYSINYCVLCCEFTSRVLDVLGAYFRKLTAKSTSTGSSRRVLYRVLIANRDRYLFWGVYGGEGDKEASARSE